MFVNDQTCPATGHTTPTPTQTTGTPYTSLSFVKVEHKGKRKQRLTTWFAVPDQDYGTGNATGYRVAAELMSWLHTRPATFNTEHVTREVMAAAVKALEEPFQHGKPNKRGAAVSFMAAMAGFIHFAARHSNHDVYLPAKVQQLKDWARETAEIESERNRAIGQRLAAARKAKRAARQAESEAKAMKAGAA